MKLETSPLPPVKPTMVSLLDLDPQSKTLADTDVVCANMQTFNEDWQFIKEIHAAKGHYKKLRKNYLKLQAHKINNHIKKDKINNYMKIYEDKLVKQREHINGISLCAFKNQLNNSIKKNLNNNKNKDFLNQVANIGTCIEKNNNQTNGLKKFFQGTFDSIFNFFTNKKNLTDEDCEVLSRTYEVWSSFQEEENKAAHENKGLSIPLYNVNPHNSSYIAWLKEKAKGNIPAGGLPTLHIDTHTDLGHVHSHGAGWSSHMKLDEISKLAVIEDDQEFRDQLRKTLSDNQTKEDRINEVLSQDIEKLRADVFTHMNDRVHEIAQPLVAGIASNVTSELIMALPPWSYRLPRNKAGDPYKVDLIHYGQDSDAMYGLSTSEEDILKARGTPIGIKTNKRKGIVRTFNLAVVDANLESNIEVKDTEGNLIATMIDKREETPNDSLLAHMPKDENQFILDIDLDAFVSEGRGTDGVTPKSFGRHTQQYGTHNGHDVNTETDPNVQVPLREFELIENRVDHFFKNLEEMKTAGKLPAVITIADSTLLQSMAGADPDDSQVGGNYTPSCLAFLLNYRIKQGLKEIYNIEGQD